MTPNPNQPNNAKPVNRKAVFFLVFLPLIVLFDVFYYWYTRSTCFNCGNFNEFVQSSSLSFYLIAQTVAMFRKK